VLGGNGNLIMMMMENNNTRTTTTWSSNTGSEGVTAMQLLENGNLVLSATTTKSTVEKNNSGAVVWQSFDYPTDTIITGQQLKNTSYMYAAMSTRAHLSGEMYSLRVQTYTNDLSLFVDFNPPSDYLLLPIPAANESFGANRYWTANTEFMVPQNAWVCCGGSYAELNNGLTVYDSQGYTTISTSSNNLNPNLTFLEYARVLPDGNLQSFVFRDGQWKLNFEALTNLCHLPDACGSYGICDEEEAAALVAGVSSFSSKSFCHGCPPGFHAINQTDLSMGCEALEVLVESCTTAAAPAGGSGRASSPAIELVNLTGVSNSALLEYYYYGTLAPVYPYLQVDLDHGAEACESLCERNCSCSAALYNPDFSACFLLPSALGTLMQSPSYANQTLFIKIPKGSPLSEPPSPSPSPSPSATHSKSPEAAPSPSSESSSSPSTTDGNNSSSSSRNPRNPSSRDSSSLSTQKKAAIGVAAGVMAVLLVLLSALFLHRRRMQQAQQEMAEDESFLETLPGLPPRFSYKELMIATSNFSKKLGKGGFGSVYEGVLDGSGGGGDLTSVSAAAAAADSEEDQQQQKQKITTNTRRVAVKQLEDIGQGTKEFRAEVATIGNISHVNLVPLRGFCMEGTRHRLLVYEFMPNGSLDKICFRKQKTKKTEAAGTSAARVSEEAEEEIEDPSSSSSFPVLDWETRREIAVGTARGLAYLHEGCSSRIIHCDVKPENILLDDEMRPRVADFGLAKLMRRDQSYRVTTMRGTRGYMAPEWLKDVPITEKSDVFSFGIVLLELVSGRRNFDLSVGEGEKCFLPAWAFSLLEKNGRNTLLEIVDKSLQLSQTSKTMHEEQEEEELQLQQQACLNMILVALWCIQEEISLRPTMSTVLKMLEGDADIVDPPVCSYFFVDSWLGSPSATTSSSSSAGAGAGGATSSSTADEVQIAFTSTQESQITEVVPR
jgi:serine/threonine protein kinase